MSKRHARSKPRSPADRSARTSVPSKFSWDIVIRIVVPIVFLGLGGMSMAGAYRLWTRETTVGRASQFVRSAALATETFELLGKALRRDPLDSIANYLLGSTLLRIEQERNVLGGATTVSTANLDVAMNHLTESMKTSLTPHQACLAIGQGLHFGARLSKGGASVEYVRPFAERALPFYLRGLTLNPNPPGQVNDMWIELARIADLLDRPDLVLYAIAHIEERPSEAVTPSVFSHIPSLRQNAAYTLANGPLIADTVYRRFRRNPTDKTIWTQMYLLSTVPGAQQASITLLEALARQFPDSQEPPELMARAKRNIESSVPR